MSMIRTTCLVLTLAISYPVAAERPANGDVAKAIANSVEELVEQRLIAGAQVVLGDSESIHFSDSFGVLRVDQPAAVNDETLFCIGSCSKMFAAAVVLSLVGDDILELDAPIDRWLPEFSAPKLKNGPANRAPTVRELLCHRSGIYSQQNRMTESQKKWIRDFSLTLTESVAGIANESLVAQPGEVYAYSGAGYCVLGRVAEVAAGKSFDQILSNRISLPLRIQTASYFPKSSNKNIAVGHFANKGRLQVVARTPHLSQHQRLPLIGGSLYCSANQAARFAQMLLNKGTSNDATILSPKYWNEMTRAQSELRSGGYGFGISVKVDTDSNRTYQLAHSGALNGSFCSMQMDLRSGRFAVMTYTGSSKHADLNKQLALWTK